MTFAHTAATKALLNQFRTNDLAFPPPPYNQENNTMNNGDDDWDIEETDGADQQCPLDLTISTSVHITGDHNTVALDPSASAQNMAVAVAEALKQVSMGHSGIPMIDENGRPRTIKLKLEAGVRVEGQKNVVGMIRSSAAAAVAAAGNEVQCAVRVGQPNLKRKVAEEGKAENARTPVISTALAQLQATRKARDGQGGGDLGDKDGGEADNKRARRE